MTDRAGEIRDEDEGLSGVTLSLVRLRTERTAGFIVAGSQHDFVDLEVRSSEAARRLSVLFGKLAERLEAAELAVKLPEESG